MSVGWPQTFALNLELVSRALAFYAERPHASVSEVSAFLGIGAPKVEGLNAWLKHLGLRESKTRVVTPVGLVLHHFDPSLSDVGSLCALHYLLVSNTDATVWYEIVNNFLDRRSAFLRDDLRSYFETAGVGQHTLKQLASDLGLFISTYTGDNRRALQDLHFLEVQGNLMMAKPVNDVPPLILAFCLFHRLNCRSRESTTSISRLLREEAGPGLVFRLSEQDLRQKLAALESLGIIVVTQVADIDGISYIFERPAVELLEWYFRGRQ